MATVAIKIPDGFELAEPDPRPAREGEWFLEGPLTDPKVTQWKCGYYNTTFAYYILKPMVRAADCIYSISAQQVYGTLPIIPPGYVQGPLQVKQPEGHYWYINLHGKACHWSEPERAPRIWLRKL